MDLTKLPEPDQYGNYWFAELDNTLGNHKDGPAIFPEKERILGNAIKTGRYSVWINGEHGFMADGHYRRRFFDSPEKALRELR